MSAKRQAVSDLNHDNWDKEEEPEHPGRFIEASDEEMKNRVIKKARRRINENDSSSCIGTQSIFKGFSGFTSVKKVEAPKAQQDSLFAFLSKASSPLGNSSIPSSTITTTSSVTNSSIAKPISSFISGTVGNKPPFEMEGKNDNVYYSKIIKLNNSFCDWIVKHVKEQPLCNLTSTFKDYEKYMKELTDERSKESNNTMNSIKTMPSVNPIIVTSATTSNTATSTAFINSFKYNTLTQNSKSPELGSPATIISNAQNLNASKEKEESVKANSSIFGFNMKSAEKTNGNTSRPLNFIHNNITKTEGDSLAGASKAKFIGSSFSFPFNVQSNSFDSKSEKTPPATKTGLNFGLKKVDAPSSSDFSFTTGNAPFTFANIKPPPAEPKKEDDKEGDDVDEPPKEEIKEIVEEDAFFTKRCKVFVKKDNIFKDHGVGTLHLKPVKDSDKTQLLVRSSNNLGTILVNVILVDGMPTQRMGKNNVLLVHPGGTEDAKPRTTLFRVKDSIQADELLEMINKHKK